MSAVRFAPLLIAVAAGGACNAASSGPVSVDAHDAPSDATMPDTPDIPDAASPDTPDIPDTDAPIPDAAVPDAAITDAVPRIDVVHFDANACTNLDDAACLEQLVDGFHADNLGFDELTGVAVHGIDLFVIGSYHSQATSYPLWMLQKRSAISGEIETGFGDAGVIAPTVPYHTATSRFIFFVGDYFYWTGDRAFSDTVGGWRIEKRRLDDGALATDFGASGAVDAYAGGAILDYDRSMTAASISPTTLYLAGPQQRYFGQRPLAWVIGAFALDSGKIRDEFGASGVLIVHESTTTDSGPLGLATDGASLWVSGIADGAYLVERRDAITGALDPSFGVDGVVTLGPASTAPPNVFDGHGSLALADGRLYHVASQPYTWRLDVLDAATGLPAAGFETCNDAGWRSVDDGSTILVDSRSVHLGPSVLQSLEPVSTAPLSRCPGPGGTGAAALATDDDFIYTGGNNSLVKRLRTPAR
jgi:hypothetical protein